MEIFLILFFILFFIFFVWPLINVAYKVHRFKKQARRAYEEQFGGQQSTRQAEERKAGWSGAPKRKKKIDGNVGEYVKFEEISEVRGGRPPTESRGSESREPQVSDAEWVDLK